MSPTPLARIGAPAVLLAGLLLLVAAPFELAGDLTTIPHSELVRQPSYLLDNLFQTTAFALLTLGVVGLGAARAIGPAGVVAGVVAGLLGYFTRATHAFVQPAMAVAAPALLDDPPGGLLAIGFLGSMLLSTIGLIVVAVSMWRGNATPRVAAVLVGVGAVAFPLGAVAVAILGSGLVWAGVAGLRTRSTVLPQPV